MLKGKSILLRPVHQSDLQELYARHIDISNRGNFYPLGFVSESEFRRRFEDKGFWEKEEGMLLIVDGAGKMLGHIEFFKTVNYLDELEISYQIYEQDDRGHGYATEAVNLLVRYLFGRLNTTASGSSSTPKIAPRVVWPKNAALPTKALPVAPGITWGKITTLKYTPSSGMR
jgi:[ribosomal protein S5]-alanine N-acetyltransferase